MYIKQLSVFVENKPGRLAEITSIIAEKGINMRALSVTDTKEFGILRVIVDKPDEAAAVLKSTGLTVSLSNVIAIGIDDKPGAFAAAIKVLADVDITVDYIYAFVPRTENSAYVILHVGDTEAAVKALTEAGIEIVTAEKIM